MRGGLSVYNVDFNDLGGSLLSKFQSRTTGPDQRNSSFDWLDNAAGIGSASLPTGAWSLNLSLPEAGRLSSVRVLTMPGIFPPATSLREKDTTSPNVTNLVAPQGQIIRIRECYLTGGLFR